MDSYFIDIETSGLDPKSSFISLIGIYGPGGVRIFTGASEEEVLRSFWDWNSFGQRAGDVFVSYNGAHFDFPFIAARCSVNPSLVRFCGWAQGMVAAPNHIDLILKARNVPFLKSFYAQRERFSKDELCRHLGIYVPKTATGAECAWIAQSVAAGKSPASALGRVVQHNAMDLVATAQLYEIFEREGWL